MSETPPEKKRRGKAVKDEKGKPASFVPGAGEAPRVFDEDAIAKKLHLWWADGDGQTFILGQDVKMMPSRGGDELMQETPQVWSRWPEKKIVNLLRMNFVRVKAREGEQLSETERTLMHIMSKRRLEMEIRALAGYPAGIHHIGGQKMLVRTSPNLVEPKKGEWPTVAALLKGKLDLSEAGGPDQTTYFHGWMKMAVEGLYLGGPGNFRPGQCLIFAGPADCGKSRIQHQVITGLLGGTGRNADPGPYLFGRTDFNEEMFAAEHLMMEDPASSTKTVDRVKFGEMLKQIVVNDTQRMHAKRENAMTVMPFFRLTISINDDPDKMRVLPLLTPDMKDKVMLFVIHPAPLPMPTTTLDERLAFRERIASELPAYAWWLLNEFQVPASHQAGRFGVKEWHHPALAMELFDDTPAAELLTIIDAAEFTKLGLGASKLWDLDKDGHNEAKKDFIGSLWSGTALELERLLLSEVPDLTCTVSREAKKLLMHHKIERLLSRLKEDRDERVVHWRTNSKRGWTIQKPVS